MAEIDGVRSKIYQMLKDLTERDYKNYETINVTDKYWKLYEESIKDIDGIDCIVVDKPIYFKISDRQYFFIPGKTKTLRKHLYKSLDDILGSAQSMIDAINDLETKGGSEEENELSKRKIKLREMLIRIGRKRLELDES